MLTLTSKQRAYLKSLAQKIDPIFQIGKNGLTPEITEAISRKTVALTINVLTEEKDFLL